jgi:uncharacterized protein YcfJ
MKLFTTTMAAIAIALPTYADTVRATVSRIQPIYQNTTVSVPSNTCRDVEVPIYGEMQGQTSNSGDVLLGAIIGGLFGGTATNSDAGAAIGAFTGAVIAGENGKSNTIQVITGYSLERRCYTNYVNHTEKQLKHYKIWFTWNGIKGSAVTYNQYQVGNRIPVEVSLRAK